MILKPAALLAAIVTLTFAGAAFAADPVNIEIMAIEEEPGRMVLTISAVDDEGQPFPGLDPSSFNAWINDQPLIVKELRTSTDREPASVLLLVDVSSSMSGEPIQQAQVAISEFVDVLEPQDEVAIMAFSSGVQLLQDFTADRDALDAAVADLTLTDDTALYDGVIEAASRMGAVDRSRKLIVLLSDGLANVNQDARDASIDAALEAGVSVIAVGLGANTDVDYLTQLTDTSGGALIQAATPAELRAAYTDLAFAIRSQYIVVTDVPRSIDRTIAGTLKVHVIHRADNAFAERPLEPLEGAFPPPFSMTISGITPGEKHNGAVEIVPAVQEGIEVVKVDYYLDDELVQTVEGAGTYTVDASVLENGSHVLKVVATDTEGREGEVQVPFLVPVLAAPSEGTSLPLIPLLALVLLLGVGYVAFKFGRKRWQQISTPTYSRVDTWASVRTPGGGQKPEEFAAGDDDSPHPLTRPVEEKVDEAVRGRVVVMDEAAVRGGELETILEFEMKSQPLTFGSGPNADMRVGDAGGLIAAEEARVWVQRGRMVYHKLTTLSAMATEGVTAGWQFLEDGDEMRIGPYRIIFQAAQKDDALEDESQIPDGLPQEHGMALRRAFGLTETDRSPDMNEWVGEQAPMRPASGAVEPSKASDDPVEASAPQDVSSDLEASDGWQQPDTKETPEQTPQVSSQWDIPQPQTSEWGSAAPSSSWDSGSQTSNESEQDGEESQDSGSWESAGASWSLGGPAEEQDSESAQPEQWGPTMLEPKSADWLVEQSQPIEDGGQIIQPDTWSSFASSDDDAASGATGDSEDGEDPEERAWGT